MDAAEFNVSVFNWNRGQDELIGVTSVKVCPSDSLSSDSRMARFRKPHAFALLIHTPNIYCSSLPDAVLLGGRSRT